MSGLQVWDGGGNLIFDQTTPVVKFLGTVVIGGIGNPSYTGSAQSGSVTDPRFTQFAGHTPFVCRIDGGVTTAQYDAVWSFNGNVLTWYYPRSDPGSLVIDGATYHMNRPTQRIVFGIR